MEQNGINYLIIKTRITMKKYFLADTDDELVFGDVVNVTLEKKTENGLHKFTNDVTFSEDNLYFLLDMGIIEERESEEGEENNNLINFNDDVDVAEAFDDFLRDFEALEDKVDKLETLTLDILKETLNVAKCLAKEHQQEEKKPGNKAFSLICRHCKLFTFFSF